MSNHDQSPPPLFSASEAFQSAGVRRRRALILRRLLREEGGKSIYCTPEVDAAHAEIKKWADMVDRGQLLHKETSLDAEFLHDVFGKALGYKSKTNSPDAYHLERQYTIPGNGLADGALGFFPLKGAEPAAVIELKGAEADLDRTRHLGRTPVQQCWDYLNAQTTCRWGIVSNFKEIRLYHRDYSSLAFEQFYLRDLRDDRRFREFYSIFHIDGLIRKSLGRLPVADRLVDLTVNRQRSVGDELYKEYNDNRINLIYHLHKEKGHDVEDSIHVAQKILDRIIFVAFCEDRDLLPDKSLERAYKQLPPLTRVTNPRWQNFLSLFRAVDQGHADIHLKYGYNGGLFRHDPLVDDLDLNDDWTLFFKQVGDYDFRDEVNVDVLGHLFERSVTELEKMRSGGLFEAAENADQPRAMMQKSAARKRMGTYYTPPEFTRYIVKETIGTLIDHAREELEKKYSILTNEEDRPIAFWKEYQDAVASITVCDPACGSGAFLVAAYDLLEEVYILIAHQLSAAGDDFAGGELADLVAKTILSKNLYGVDLSQQAVEITQLALWIRSAKRGETLADLSRNIICGNSLVRDDSIDIRAFQWPENFADVFSVGGFDCVIGNPPWERLKLQEREFFAWSAPKIATAVSAANRRKSIARLETEKPELFRRYTSEKESAERMLNYARTSGMYPLAGKGDINTYMLFAELAREIVRPKGRVGLLLPSGIATDKTTREYFQDLIDNKRLIAMFDFENRKGLFPDVHRSFKFCIFLFGGKETNCDQADFVFFAHAIDELEDPSRHIRLTATDIALVNPNTRTCPIFRTKRDAEITKSVYQRIPVLVDESRQSGGNPWGIKFVTMFHQTNDAEHFQTADELIKKNAKRDGSRWKKGKTIYLPLYEAKMIQAYDHRAAGVVVEEGNWMRQGQTEPTTLVSHQNYEHTVEPRWWVNESEVAARLNDHDRGWFLCFKDVTSPTNERTMIASFIPTSGVVNSAPIVVTPGELNPHLECCLLANLNCLIYDFLARQKVGGVHLNFFIVRQIPTVHPDDYDQPCAWARGKLVKWISDRVLKLSCTANDMKPLADACGFKKGVNRWDNLERARLRAELDAAYFHLYGINREDAEYVLGTFSGTERRDIAETGNFTTRKLVLDAYDELAGKMNA